MMESLGRIALAACDRNCECDRRSTAETIRFGPNATAMAFDDSLAGRQTNAASGILIATVLAGLDSQLEDLRQCSRFDADSVVGHPDSRQRRVLPRVGDAD